MQTETVPVNTPTPSTLDFLIDGMAERIAKSRYEAWDGHAKGADAVPWEKYRHEDPKVAEGIYLEDGRRDALALLPFVATVITKLTPGMRGPEDLAARIVPSTTT